MTPIQNITPIAMPSMPTISTLSEAGKAEQAFGGMVTQLINDTEKKQQIADNSIRGVHAGTEENLHSAMIAMEKADISLRYMVQVRNKAVEAYQEIMRIQL